MEWNKIKNTYTASWYELIDYIADPGIYKERRIGINGSAVAVDTKETDSEDWYEIDELHSRDLYEFFELSGIFVVILYNEWFGYYSYEIYSELKNEISHKFETRKEAETDAFRRSFAIMEKQFMLV